MQADALSPDIWNAIAREMERLSTAREVHVGKVIKRDTLKKHVWLEAFGEVAIPIVALSFGFDYFDTQPTGNATKRTLDATDMRLTMPTVGQTVVVLDPGGNRRFPMCIGVIQSSSGYWQGE
jgi:hypothetical protein